MEALKADLAARVVKKADGPELREADLEHAERVLKEELSRRGWREAELSRHRKADPEKVEIASQLRARTTVTLKWITERLKMGAWTYVSNCLVQKRKGEEKYKWLWATPAFSTFLYAR